MKWPLRTVQVVLHHTGTAATARESRAPDLAAQLRPGAPRVRGLRTALPLQAHPVRPLQCAPLRSLFLTLPPRSRALNALHSYSADLKKVRLGEKDLLHLQTSYLQSSPPNSPSVCCVKGMSCSRFPGIHPHSILFTPPPPTPRYPTHFLIQDILNLRTVHYGRPKDHLAHPPPLSTYQHPVSKKHVCRFRGNDAAQATAPGSIRRHLAARHGPRPRPDGLAATYAPIWRAGEPPQLSDPGDGVLAASRGVRRGFGQPPGGYVQPPVSRGVGACTLAPSCL